MPNTVLTGTTTAAVSRVSLIAAIVSGSAKLPTKTPKPLRERLDQDHAERRDEQQPEEADGHQDQRDARRAHALRYAASFFDDMRGARHQRPAAT